MEEGQAAHCARAPERYALSLAAMADGEAPGVSRRLSMREAAQGGLRGSPEFPERPKDAKRTYQRDGVGKRAVRWSQKTPLIQIKHYLHPGHDA